MSFTYLIYQTEDGVRVSRSDGRVDTLTRVYSSMAEVNRLMLEVSDREPEVKTVGKDRERKPIKNYTSGNRPPKARGR